MSKVRPTIGTDGLALPVLPPERDARVWARLVRVMFYTPGFLALLLIKAGCQVQWLGPQTAEDIQAGLTPRKEQVQQNQNQIQAEQQKLQQEQQQLTAEQKKIAANKAAIGAANKRFGELADYNILVEVIVLFGNDQTLRARTNQRVIPAAKGSS